MSDRRVLAVSAAFITAAIFLFLLGTYPSWKAAIGSGLSWRPETSEAPAVPPAPLPTRTAPAAPAAPPPSAKPVDGKQSAAPGSSNAVAAGSITQAAPQPAVVASPTPSFDVVRVEPNGDSVIAARGRAGDTIVLLDQGHPIARAQADATGQVAFVPPPLAPGDHSLMLSLGEPNAPGALSSQSVAVSVPDRAKAAPLVALLQPEQPTKLLSGVSPAGQGTAAVPQVSVGAIDVEEMGSIYATGRATPGSQCRVYLNGSFVAGVRTGSDGTWSLKIEHGMRPGHYSVRVDELASAAGDVRARAEVPFDYPARASAAVSLLRPAKGRTASVAPVPAASAVGGTAAARTPSGAPGTAAGNGSAQPGADLASPTATARSGSDGVGPVTASATEGSAAVPSPGVPTVVAQLLTTKVIHGDSLWRISRKMLGHGRRYTQIYAANTTQIRDPKLIYPGQIFVMPQNVP